VGRIIGRTRLALTSERRAGAQESSLSRKGLLRTLLLVLLRKDSLLILLVSSIPAALTASYSLLSPVFSEEDMSILRRGGQIDPLFRRRMP